MSSNKFIPNGCIDPIIKELKDLHAKDFLSAIRAFLGNPKKNEEIFLPKYNLLDLLLNRKWGSSKKYTSWEYTLMKVMLIS